MEESNRCIDNTRPWELAKAEQSGAREAGERLDTVLAALVQACRVLSNQLQPFLPDAASRIAGQCAEINGSLPPANPLSPRIAEGNA
ncbi:hypothetical protein AB0E78_33540 [Streptomyces sp. NPDC032198]|uniref:hypothetical protein n=1 Tax=Streptomyces sp. NPDC032198 TaxID=3155127 RepID=UPI003410A200